MSLFAPRRSFRLHSRKIGSYRALERHEPCRFGTLWEASRGTGRLAPALTLMAANHNDRGPRIEPAILVVLGLVFLRVILVHAIALVMEGG